MRFGFLTGKAAQEPPFDYREITSFLPSETAFLRLQIPAKKQGAQQSGKKNRPGRLSNPSDHGPGLVARLSV